MRHVLVTGGSGFIGRYVVERLHRGGYHPVVLEKRIPLPISAEHDFERYFGDVRDATLVSEAVAHVDGVIHLAGVLGTQETIENPTPAAETNILGGLNVIAACSQYDVPLVNIGVGNFWMNNTYSITKHTVERLVEMTHRFRGKAMTTVRALNAYGPRQVPAAPYGPSRVRKVMPSFICRALSGLPIEIYGDGMQVMDMVFVEDVAEVLVRALEHTSSGSPPQQTVEAGTGRPTTILDVATAVAHAAARLSVQNVKIDHLPMRPGEDPGSTVLADTEALGQLELDAANFISLEEGVERTVRYYQQYLAEHDA